MPHSPVVRTIRRLLYANEYTCRYLRNVPFRTKVHLAFSLSLNLLYAAGKLSFGIFYTSFWFDAVAVYYFLLCAIRIFLMRRVPKENNENDYKKELTDYG